MESDAGKNYDKYDEAGTWGIAKKLEAQTDG